MEDKKRRIIILHRIFNYKACKLAATTFPFYYTVALDGWSETRYVRCQDYGINPYTYLCRLATWPYNSMPSLDPSLSKRRDYTRHLTRSTYNDTGKGYTRGIQINKTGDAYIRRRNTHDGRICIEDGYIQRRETDLRAGGRHLGEKCCNGLKG